MLDLSHSRARRGGIALAVAFALAAPAAVAQEAGPYPVVDLSLIHI